MAVTEGIIGLHQLLYLPGPFIYRCPFGITVIPFHRILVRKTVGPVDLDSVGGGLICRFLIP